MTIREKNKKRSFWLLLCCAFLLVACAGNAVPPVKEISTVEKELSVARGSDAEIYAPLELRYAEDKLRDAKSALAREEYDKARQLTEEASINAKLAEAKASAEKEKKLVQETKDNIDILRKEIERVQKK